MLLVLLLLTMTITAISLFPNGAAQEEFIAAFTQWVMQWGTSYITTVGKAWAA
jgi:dolichol kinase